MNTYNANINSASFRLDQRPTMEREKLARWITQLQRSIADLEAAGRPTEFYERALDTAKALLEGEA